MLGFGKTELLPTDKQVGVALAPEVWGTGKLTLSDEDEACLAAEADAFLALVAK